MSQLELILSCLLMLAVGIAVGKSLALGNEQAQRAATSILLQDLREKAALVREAQAQRKRATAPSDMKKANLALDRAIEELI